MKIGATLTLEVSLEEAALRWMRKHRTKVIQKVLSYPDQTVQNISPWIESKVTETTLMMM